jgi:glycogen debranching enzyme
VTVGHVHRSDSARGKFLSRPVKISVGPPHLAISWGQAVLLTELSGEIISRSQKGLYFFDTRMISHWRLYANGTEWDLLNSGGITYYACRIFLINRAIAAERGEIPARTVSLVISRCIGQGLHEDLDITNHGRSNARFNLEIALRSDFADIFEAKSGHLVRRGRITSDWSHKASRLRLIYRNKDFCRQLTVTSANSDGPAFYANGRIAFEVEIAPGARWHACLLYELGDERHLSVPPRRCMGRRGDLGDPIKAWRRTVLKVSTSNAAFERAFDQAIADMGALRLPIPETTGTEFVPAAGVPWFMAVFGRDSLIAALQNIFVHPDFARSTLALLGSLQAKERDDFRDAEPGKIPHELRHGELAHFGLIPHTPYYGTADATPLYLILLHAAWRASGDLEFIKTRLETAERCLDWIDQFGDRDGDGFQEYEARSPAGYENQSWKDSGAAIVYPDGTLVQGPKALCELQGYVYDAWKRTAQLYDALGRHERAAALRRKADELFSRFNEKFWDESEGFYALALDGEKKQVVSVASNPGHCLWSGIVPRERARRVVARLMQPDMWSGWGVRTLSANHPAYNPYSYQNGSVWPHDNGIIALGFRRYGFTEAALRVAKGIIEASGYFVMQQLPELYAGIEASAADFPVQYLGANVPQAWAAGSVFFLLQSILGVRPDAPRGVLYVDPKLPDWLPDVMLSDLRIGSQVLDIEFRRKGKKTEFSVVKGDPAVVIERAFEGYPFDVENELTT